MIEPKKSYFFIMPSIYLMLLLSFVMAADSVYLWDLGVGTVWHRYSIFWLLEPRLIVRLKYT